MNLPVAMGSLLAVTVITSFCADYRTFNPPRLSERESSRPSDGSCETVVGSIDEFANEYGIPSVTVSLSLSLSLHELSM
jgi:hypothetical protein